MPYTRANGVSLYYEQQGEGPDLLLISGLSAHSGSWALQRPALAERFRVTVLDNRGAGRSDAPDEPYSIHLMADDAVGLLRELGMAKAHVVGHSMGGMIAQELAINYPDLVDRLVLASTRAKPGPVRHLMAPVDRWLRENGLDRSSLALLTMPWGMTPTFMADEARVLQRLALAKADLYPIKTHAYLRQHAAVMSHDATDRLDRIVAPTLVLVGAEDVMTPAWESRALAEGISGSTLQILPKGGHGFFAEYPEETSAALLEFLLAR